MCPFSMMTSLTIRRRTFGYCWILRNFYLDKYPISIESEKIDYPAEYRNELLALMNGARFCDIPEKCKYKFYRLEDI
jgi:hypothetical protein